MPEWDNDDDDYSSDSDLVKQLRKQLRETRRQAETFESEVKTLRPQVRKNAISSTLSKLGYPSKLSAFVPADLETDEATVKGWLDEYGDLFNLPPKNEVIPVDQDAPQTNVGTGQTIPPAMAQQWARMQGGDSAIGTSVPDAEKAQMSQLGEAAAKSNGNFDQFIALLRNEPLTPM